MTAARTELGELLYRLKYRGDQSAIAPISTPEDFDDTIRAIEGKIALAKTEDVRRKWQNTLAFIQHRRPDISVW